MFSGAESVVAVALFTCSVASVEVSLFADVDELLEPLSVSDGESFVELSDVEVELVPLADEDVSEESDAVELSDELVSPDVDSVLLVSLVEEDDPDVSDVSPVVSEDEELVVSSDDELVELLEVVSAVSLISDVAGSPAS